MKLYHYSKKKYDVLKTLEAQTPVTEKERKNAIVMRKARLNVPPGLYFEHVSFFFDKIEKDHWKFYPPSHDVWFKGNELFEYEVDVSSIDDFKWCIVETPEITAARLDVGLSNEEFWKIYKEINLRKYVGHSSKGFEQAAKPFIGMTRKYAEISVDEPNPENRAKYAAGVPHVMLYPKGGVIQYQSVKPIRL